MELISALFILAGSCLFLSAAVALIRFPDSFSRMHAASKVSSLGIGLILVGVVFHFRELKILVEAILVIAFIFLTTPVAAQMLTRAAYLRGADIWRGTKLDEMKESVKIEQSE